PNWSPAPAPPATKSRAGVIVAVVAALVVLLCAGVVTTVVVLVNKTRVAVENADPVPAAPELPNGSDPGETVTVGYEVNGEGEAASITYRAEGGQPKVLQNVELPWRVEVRLPKPLLPSVFAVRSSQSGGGEFSCRVTVDGREAAMKETNGTETMVICMAFDQN
ncbi:MAG TPA: MmpS family transport accessory protein, partial [Micromonospora sp.]